MPTIYHDSSPLDLKVGDSIRVMERDGGIREGVTVRFGALTIQTPGQLAYFRNEPDQFCRNEAHRIEWTEDHSKPKLAGKVATDFPCLTCGAAIGEACFNRPTGPEHPKRVARACRANEQAARRAADEADPLYAPGGLLADCERRSGKERRVRTLYVRDCRRTQDRREVDQRGNRNPFLEALPSAPPKPAHVTPNEWDARARLRDEIAIAAMTSLIRMNDDGQGFWKLHDQLATEAYSIAEAMMKRREAF